MESFLRRFTPYTTTKTTAKIDIPTMPLKNRQLNENTQEQKLFAYDNHFQIVKTNKRQPLQHHQQQQKTEQYSYKTYGYYSNNNDNDNLDLSQITVQQQQQRQDIYNNAQEQQNQLMQKTTIQHRTTDNNNNFGYTTTTAFYRKTPTTGTNTNEYEFFITTDPHNNSNNYSKIRDLNGEQEILEMQQKQEFDYNIIKQQNCEILDENSLYVAIKNDMPINTVTSTVATASPVTTTIEKYSDILLPALKFCLNKLKRNEPDDNEYSENSPNVSQMDTNTTTVMYSTVAAAEAVIHSNALKHKQQQQQQCSKMQQQQQQNHHQQQPQQQITKTNTLQRCRKKVLNACNKTLTNILTTSKITSATCKRRKLQKQHKNYQSLLHNSNNHHHHQIAHNKHRQQQQFRLLPSLGTTSFLTLLTLICLETLLLTTVTDCAKTFYMHWNTSNSIFRIDNTDHIIDVNKGNLAFEFDQVHIICPVYEPGTYENETEKYIIYNVSKVEYETCRITNADPRVIAICDKPQKLMFFTITFRPFTPQPGGLEFLPGNDYYFISTSSKDDLYRRIGGRCSTNNMKVVFKVCCAPEDKNKTNASSIGGGGGGTAGGSSVAVSGIAASETATVSMDGSGVGGVGGHQTHTTTTQQLNKNVQMIGANTAIMPIGGGAAGTNTPLKPMKIGGGGGTSINTNIDQFNRIPLQQQTHGINIIGNNMATSMGQLPHSHNHGHPGLDTVNSNGINSAINVVVNGGAGGSGSGIMLAPNHGMLPANGIGISGYSNIGHTNGEIGIGTGIRINNVPTQSQYHPPYKQGNNNKLNTNGDEHHFNKHPNEVVKNEELTYNSAAYSLHKSSTTTVTFLWKFIWKLSKNTWHGFVHFYNKFNSQIEMSTTKITKQTNEHLITRHLNAFNCVTKEIYINLNTTTKITKFQNSIADLSVLKRLGLCLDQASLEIKYLFKKFHPILLLISILIVMAAYYQLIAISLNNNIHIIMRKTTAKHATTTEKSKRSQHQQNGYTCSQYHDVYMNEDRNVSVICCSCCNNTENYTNNDSNNTSNKNSNRKHHIILLSKNDFIER